MRLIFATVVFALLSVFTYAQHSCASYEYQQEQLQRGVQPFQELSEGMRNVIAQEIQTDANATSIFSIPVIKIPVVVHVIYNAANQNISDEQIKSQLDVLNTEFRKRHRDTVAIPSVFKSRAADCYIEFVLARVNPQGAATNGIVRKKTSYSVFGLDDKVKSSNTGGDDAWDSDRYLNIWVCNTISGLNGYSSIFGGPKTKDGIVIRHDAFGTMGTATAPYHKGRTAIHELGHWMGLKHIWGDQNCGNDGIDDTPAQSAPTKGCPTGTIVSCTNAGTGNMYNNYMDLTNDECTNMFTLGQRDKMRSSFIAGAPHYTLSKSDAATASPTATATTGSIATNSAVASVLGSVKFYPNPATEHITVDITKQESLLGKFVTVHNQLGQQVMQVQLSQTHTTLNIAALKEGMYFVKIPAQSGAYKLIKSGSSINP